MESLSQGELEAILRTARDHRIRDWLMILVAYYHGLRASEVVAIVRDDVRDGFLTVRRKKGSLATTQPLMVSENLLFSEQEPITAQCLNLRPNQRLFPISRQHFWAIVQRHAANSGIPKHKAHPHVFKHSCAMQMIDSAGIHRTQAWLGHKSMSSTGRYLNPTNEDVAAAARKALGGLGSD